MSVRTAAVSVVNMSLLIDGVSILEEISGAFPEGSLTTVIGPNGAGKTSLLTCIGRLKEVTSGEITILGVPIKRYGNRELAKRISYVPQAEGRLLPVTVDEFVMMARYPYFSMFSSGSGKDREAVDEAIAVTNIQHFRDRHLDELSGGERQKVFIAAALAQGASILLMDEPTTFLDYKQEAGILKLIFRLNKERGLTVIMVTHDLNKGVFQSDQVFALKNGRSMFLGSPDELIRGDTLDRIYDLTFDVIGHPKTGARMIYPREML